MTSEGTITKFNLELIFANFVFLLKKATVMVAFSNVEITLCITDPVRNAKESINVHDEMIKSYLFLERVYGW